MKSKRGETNSKEEVYQKQDGGKGERERALCNKRSHINRKQGSSPKCCWDLAYKGLGSSRRCRAGLLVFQVPTKHRHPQAQAQGGDFGAMPEEKLKTYLGKA